MSVRFWAFRTLVRREGAEASARDDEVAAPNRAPSSLVSWGKQRKLPGPGRGL